MPAKQLTSNYVEWTGKDAPFATVADKARFHTEPFVILDAALIPTRYGRSAMFLIQACDSTGDNVTGEEAKVLAFSDRDSAPSRREAVAEVQTARLEGSWIGPCILADFETPSGDDPFVTIRNYDPSRDPAVKETVKASRSRKSTTVEATEAETVEADEIPF